MGIPIDYLCVQSIQRNADQRPLADLRIDNRYPPIVILLDDTAAQRQAQSRAAWRIHG